MTQETLVAEIIQRCSHVATSAVVAAPEGVLDTVATRLRAQGFFVRLLDEAVLTSKEELLQAVAHACDFPGYFGYNWDALLDMFVDFSWQPAPGYILVLRHPEHLPSADQNIFFDIIRDASALWAAEQIPFKLLTAE